MLKSGLLDHLNAELVVADAIPLVVVGLVQAFQIYLTASRSVPEIGHLPTDAPSSLSKHDEYQQ